MWMILGLVQKSHYWLNRIKHWSCAYCKITRYLLHCELWKMWSTFVIITLYKHVEILRTFVLLYCVLWKKFFAHRRRTCPPGISNVLIRYFVVMKRHISYFYNALLEYDPLYQVWCETKFIKNRKKQIDSHKVCSKCLPLVRTQARKRVAHWSTASSLLATALSRAKHATVAVAAHRCHELWFIHWYTRSWMRDQNMQMA